MRRCRHMRGLMAAAVYDDLPERDRDALDRHLDTCAACREQHERLRALVSQIPVTVPELNVSLLPGVRRRLAEQEIPRRALSRRLVYASAVLIVVIGLSVYTVLRQSSSSTSVESTRRAWEQAAISPIRPLLAEAERSVANHRDGDARSLLIKAVETYPQDPLAGEAQRRLADLAFAQQDYAFADKAYERLARDYNEHWIAVAEEPAGSEMVRRWNLLAEARPSNYESLYAFDNARESVESERFQKLEDVVAEYAGTVWVAAMAVEEMQRVVETEAAAQNQTISPLKALEKARDTCANAAAVARLNYEIAHVYWNDRRDGETARQLWVQVAQNANVELAQLAEDSLRLLDTRP
ncbi:MAG TPA: hypothetical protein HPP83_08230 [Candidatus Hydrogenedentes bacterium]|nr:hypothetical protein [Candidatus Hydrogenedentota bacterium]